MNDAMRMKPRSRRSKRIYLLDGKQIESSDCGGFVHRARKDRSGVLKGIIKKGEKLVRFNNWKMGNEVISLEDYVRDHDEGKGVILGVRTTKIRPYGIICNAVVCERFFAVRENSVQMGKES